MSYFHVWGGRGRNYLSDVPFKISKPFAVHDLPTVEVGDCLEPPSVDYSPFWYGFDLEREILSTASREKALQSLDARLPAPCTVSASVFVASNSAPLLPANGPSCNVSAAGCSLLLPMSVAASGEGQKKPKTVSEVNLEEFEMLDSTPFHRLELTTLNELDELKDMLADGSVLSNGDVATWRQPGEKNHSIR